VTLPPLAGPLHYLIGGNDTAHDQPGIITELSYDADHGETRYGNLRDEKGRYTSLRDANRRGRYAPYLPGDDITGSYGEFTPNPRGGGYLRNIRAQIARAIKFHAVRIEWDNPDSAGLSVDDVLIAHNEAWAHGLRTIAKNPLLVSDPAKYISHQSIDLVVMERDDEGRGSDAMDLLRRSIGQPELAVRFVAFHADDENGLRWANAVASNIRRKGLQNMGVTFSYGSEYGSSTDLQRPLP
jgi:hypothetical protein